jgi:hypothetical protein
MIIIFDTYAGLCNQFYDVVNGIIFCLKNNLRFTFRYCSFRNDDLCSFSDSPFETLFDINFLKNYELYINYNDIKDKITNENCYNYGNRLLTRLVFKDKNILDQLINLNKDYVVLRQFWVVHKLKNSMSNPITTCLRPSSDIMKKYIEIKTNIIGDEPYNFIHYRYERDFTKHFKVKVEKLDILIDNIKFKNNNLKIFIATSNLKGLIDLNNCKYKNLIFKNDDMLLDLNFEQRAFIDYMFGLNSVECYGHSKSSFSLTINNIKNTNNYYD